MLTFPIVRHVLNANARSFGDGPVLQYTSEGEPVLVGLLTSVSSCGDAFSPNFYLRVAPLVEGFLPAEITRTSDVRQVPFDGSDAPPPPIPPHYVANTSAPATAPTPSVDEDEEPQQSAEPDFPLAGIITGAVLLAAVIVIVVIIVFVVRTTRS